MSGAGSLPSIDEWRRLEPLIDAMLDAPPESRAAVAAQVSGGDANCRQELIRLAAKCESACPLLDRSAAECFTAVFADQPLLIPEPLADRYRILEEVGRGGMAIVYVARDVRHGRDVAVKVIRPELVATLGRARFLREIEIAARLRHPNIVPLYDSGEAPGLLYYVMPYEAGQSVRARLMNGGPLPVEDAVAIVSDVCEALAHAHQHGIVHRDIKPDNILLSGRHALITDFGVARAVTEATPDAAFAVRDIAFGTAAYMAPEQAANDPRVDHRADIYAAGVLAYELLTGALPPSPDAATKLASIRADVPDALATTIAKCMATRPADRWASADELRGRLASIVKEPSASRGKPSSRTAVYVGAAVASLLAAAAVAVMRSRVERLQLRVGAQSRLTSEPGLEVQPVISPDGRDVAYAAGHSLQMRIYIRPVAGGKAIPLTTDTTANQWQPRWSPDGTRILFLSRGGVFSAPRTGGQARQEILNPAGTIVTSAFWSADGHEVAYVRGDSVLARSIRTGDVRLITTGGDLHSCRWSPDGARLACVCGNSFYMTVGAIYGLGPMFGNLAPSKIVLIPAAGGVPLSVTDSGSLHQSPVWSPDGRTLYYVSNRQGARDIYALDVSARTDPVRVTQGMGAHSIDFSTDGRRIVYSAYTSSANVWAMPIPSSPPGSFASAVAVTSGNQTVEGVRVSPDGRWVIYDSDLSGNSDLYRVSVAGGEVERLTHGPLDEFRGVLSPNGNEVAYHSFQTGSRNMFLIPVGGGTAQQLTRSTGHLSMANWSPDGTALTLFDMTNDDVLVMRRDALGRWTPPRFVGGRGWRPEWSPDGRTIAFVSRTDGRIGLVPADSGAQRDLYVPHDREPLAELAIFAASGREIYFKSHDARGRASFWSIPVTGGHPRLLVRFDDLARASNRFEFASDGKRFYFTVEDRQSDIWIADLAPR